MVVDNLELCPSKVKHCKLLKHTEKIISLYISGLTLREIGQKFDVDKGAVSRLLKHNGVIVHGNRTRSYILICIDCENTHSSKCPSKLRCNSCIYIERNKQAKLYQRQFAKNIEAGNCVNCSKNLSKYKLDRKFCDNCRKRDKRYLKYRHMLLEKYHNSCFYCSKNLSNKKNITIDHVIPLCRGGTNDLSNLVIACKTCNGKKGTKTLMEFKKEVIS